MNIIKHCQQYFAVQFPISLILDFGLSAFVDLRRSLLSAATVFVTLQLLFVSLYYFTVLFFS